MANPIAMLGTAAGLILAAVALLRTGEASAAVDPALGRSTADDLGSSVPPLRLRDESDRWQVPTSADPFLASIRQAESKYNLPRNFLAAVLYQESRFRDDIISGEVTSRAGAIGIAQIIPRWHPNVDPLDPFEAIDYAASELRKWKNALGSWEESIIAYNWGPGNWRNVGEDYDRLPKETSDYIRDVMGRAEV